ncbi:MAG: UDP-N-acetylmuramate dehydrogenase [Angelakisella sp.]
MTNSIDSLSLALSRSGIPFCTNEPMSRHTTFLIGGNAAVFLRPASTGQIVTAQQLCRDHNVRLFALGRGSNLLVGDEGLPFAVLSLCDSYSGITALDATTVEVLSGTKLATLCAWAADHSLTGLEFAYGIPGSVGGAVSMNAGAYGGELQSVVRAVTFLEPDGHQVTLEHDQLDFCYRHSCFSGTHRIILSAQLALLPGVTEAIRTAMEDYLSRRREKQPLEFGSAGSTFKRPQGAFAGALIEQCGLKGYTVGGAQVSEKHAGFVINRNRATAAQVLAVMAHVQQTVEAQTGYRLEPELLIIP